MRPVRSAGQATRIRLLSFAAPHMRAFHMAWLAFFMAFFAWFAIAPLMVLVREDLGLTRAQIGNSVIASVAATVAARLLFGWLTGRIGPRLAYSALLVTCSIPVMAIGLVRSYEAFLLMRLAIGVVGASFVITQFHTSVMFAPNVVGTANATTAGWGNLGGGVAQFAMPLVVAALLVLGVNEAASWRAAMVVPGIGLLLAGIAYFFLTQDSPEGNYRDLGRARTGQANGGFRAAVQDRRVWALFAAYAACFGVSLTINNVAALYFHDRFALGIGAAGAIAASFGLMNLFARALGGICGDRIGVRFGLRGRALLLVALLAAGGVALVVFSQMAALGLAIAALIVFSLFVQMSQGATFSIVPFVNERGVGPAAGIVGAGGNVGAVLAGFLFRAEGLATHHALMVLGVAVILAAPVVLLVRFSRREEALQRRKLRTALASEQAAARAGGLSGQQVSGSAVAAD